MIFFFSSFLPPVLVHFRILLSFGQNSVTINDKKDPRWRQMTSSYNKYPILSCRTSYRLSFKRTILKCPSTTMKTPNIGSHHFHARWVMSLHVSHKGWKELHSAGRGRPGCVTRHTRLTKKFEQRSYGKEQMHVRDFESSHVKSWLCHVIK